MKVLQVITKGEAGGAQTHLLEVCRALRDQVDVAVVAGGGDEAGVFAQRLAELGIRFHHLAPMVNSLSPGRTLLAVHALTRLLRQQRPDLIHAHSGMAGAVARVAGLITGIPVVYTVHGFGFKPQVPRRQRLAARLVEWLLAPCTAHMICVSAYERTLARQLPLAPRHISVVRNALQDLPHRASPGAGTMRVIMVARCAPPKRHDLLLQALALASTRLGYEIPATLVGDGPQLGALRQQASVLGLRQVSFTGDVSNVPELLAQHHVFVLMSDHEGLPISIIEAMRGGLPILGSDLPGIAELIEDGQQGRLVGPHAELLAQALIDLAAQPAVRGRMGVAARQRYEQEYMPEQMARGILTVYAQILHHE